MQLSLEFDAPHDVLLRRLTDLGLVPIRRLRLTDNRAVMVSLTAARVLGIHRGYVHAPDSVLRAVVRFFARRVPRAERRAAQRAILSFDTLAARHPRARKPDAPRPGDLEKTDRLARLFDALNRRHFDGALPELPIRISGRMRTRLGQLCLDPATLEPFEITMSRKHLDRHDRSEAEHTLLHEMVHLWQSAAGYPVDHGPIFRSKARAVGVAPSARRSLATPSSRSRAALYD